MHREELAEQHASEKRELRKQISEILKQSRDKKSKKEARERIEVLEKELAERHLQEMALLEKDCQGEQIQEELEAENNLMEFKISKSSRRKAAKQEKERERRLGLELEASQMHDYQSEERILLKDQLDSLGLTIFDIPADGNCLYNAVSRQLKLLENVEYSVDDLRLMAAEYILNHREEFAEFIESAENEEEEGSQNKLEIYCSKITAKSPVVWGGEVEIVALSRSMRRNFVIYQAKASPYRIGQHLVSRPIQLSFHRHLLGLGNHYNSVE
jgi:OTU domain-containing protein 6